MKYFLMTNNLTNDSVLRKMEDTPETRTMLENFKQFVEKNSLPCTWEEIPEHEFNYLAKKIRVVE